MKRTGIVHGGRGRSAGIVLLMVLALLALMSVLAVTFVRVSRLERAISSNYVARTRAQMAAESGVEYAVARLYGLRGGALTADELEALRFENHPASDDIRLMLRPSFPQPAPDDSISGVVEGQGVYSTYSLRVQDESGKLNINDVNGNWNIDTDPLADSDDPDEDPDVLLSQPRLQCLFESLVDVVCEDANGTIAALELFAAREALPGKKFTSWEQVRAALVATAGMTDADYRRIEKHLTLWSWQDPNVIRPTFQLDIAAPVPPNPGPHPGWGDWYQNAYDRAKFNIYRYVDMQTKYYELEPRSPVNVNTSSQELIEALILPVEGWYLYEGEPSSSFDGCTGPWIREMGNSTYSWLDYQVYNGFYSGAPLPWQYPPANRKASATASGVSMGNYTRYGVARRTNSFGGVMAGETESIAALVAEKLYDHIHGVDGNDDGDYQDSGEIEPSPIVTWDEFQRLLYSFVDQEAQITNDQADPDIPHQADLTAAEEGFRRPYRLPVGDPTMSAESRVPAHGFGLEENSDVVVGFDRYMADALIANFNPNSRLNDVNPDQHLFLHVDKAQLTQYTTELSLQPTGVFRIQSLGSVSDEGVVDTPLATAVIDTSMQVFHLLRITSQRQFMGEPADGYDPGNPDSLYELFHETDGLFPTAGADLAQDSGELGGNDRWGPSLCSYPEPLRNAGSLAMEGYPLGAFDWFSKYDGYMMLSTWQRDRSAWPEDLGGTVTYKDFNNNGVAGEAADAYDVSPAGPQMLATMGLRWVPVPDRGDVWRDRTQGVGGLLPLVMGMNPETISDNVDTMDVPDGRGALLAWSDDYTKSGPWPPSSSGGVYGLAFIPAKQARYLRERHPVPSLWQHNTPWVTPTHWDKVIHFHWSHHTTDFICLSADGGSTNGMDAFHGMGPASWPDEYGNQYRVSWNLPTDNPVTPDLPGGMTPGILYPDGAFSDVGRTLAFPAANLGSNLGIQGSLGFWVKPHWDTGYANRNRKLFSMGHHGPQYACPLEIVYAPAGRRADGDGPGENPDVLAWWLESMDGHWCVPTHSFVAGWPYNEWDKWAYYDIAHVYSDTGGALWSSGVLMTPTMTDHFPRRVEEAHDSFAFYGHSWNYLGFSYFNKNMLYHTNDQAGPFQPTIQLSVNGIEVASMPQSKDVVIGGMGAALQIPEVDFYWEEYPFHHLAWNPNPSLSDPGIPDVYTVVPEPEYNHIGEGYMRFGMGSDAGGGSADSTFDEIATWGNQMSMDAFESVWGAGRYHSDALSDQSGNAVANVLGLYTSPAIDVWKEMADSLKTRSAEEVRLHSVNWTLYWPRYQARQTRGGAVGSIDELAGVDVQEGDPEQWLDPVTGVWDPATLDLKREAPGGAWLYSGDESGEQAFSAMADMPYSAAGHSLADHADDLKFVRGDRFRYRVYFHVAELQPILESPVLDDVTFVFVTEQPVVLSWKID